MQRNLRGWSAATLALLRASWVWIFAVCLAATVGFASPAVAQSLFTGTWTGTYTFGPMSAVLQQTGSAVSGQITDAAGCVWGVSGSGIGSQLSLPSFALQTNPAPAQVCIGAVVTMSGTLASSGTTITGNGTTILAGGSINPWTFSLTGQGGRPLQITTTSLPAGAWKTASLAFSQYGTTLDAVGGTPPYTWVVSGLPNGLSAEPMSGAISGTFSEDSENTSSFDRIKRQFTISVSVTDSSVPPLNTTSNPPLTIEFTCGGDGAEDGLIGQYTTTLGRTPTFGVNGLLDFATRQRFAPRCMDITRSARSTHYSFLELNSSNLSRPSVALFANSLLTGQGVALLLPPPLTNGPGLDGWVENLPRIPPLNGPANLGSGFRPPADQVAVYVLKGITEFCSPGVTVPCIPKGGRHMFGDAVDLPVTPSGTAGTPAMWQQMVYDAIDAGADYTESTPADAKRSCGRSVRHCVHADWRLATGSAILTGGIPYAQ